jgi:hypothetical protein
MEATAMTVLGQMFYDPGKGFDAIGRRSMPSLPLLALTVLTAGVLYWYVQTVDFGWLLAHMADSTPDMKPEQREAMRKMFNPATMTWFSVGGTLVATPLFMSIYALYYLVAARLMGSAIGYGKWFAFSVWISVPHLLTLPLMAVQILTAHGQVGFEALNMASLNELLFHLPASSPWNGWLTRLDLSEFWVMALSIIGLRAWTGRGALLCAFAALLPFVAFYGLWALKIALFA